MVLVLVDQYTREYSKLTYDVISKHATIITDPVEVTEEYRGAHFVFFEPAVGFVATPDKIELLVKSYAISPVLVYTTPEVATLFDSDVRKIRAEYSSVDWTFVYAAVNNDNAILEAYQRTLSSIDNAAIAINKLPADLRPSMQMLYSTTCSLVARYAAVVEENSKLSENAKVQQSISDKSRSALGELNTLLQRSQSKCQGYEALLSKEYDKVITGFYPERPRVLYFKSYSHVAGMDWLLSILHTVLTQQYKASAKVVTLVDSGSAKIIRYTPKRYVRVNNLYSTSEVLENDFVVKLGSYEEMFELLLTNRSGLDYLIIHDKRDSLNLALDQGLIDLRVNEMTADYANLSEHTGNIISSFGTNVDYPWDFAEVSKYGGTNSVKLTGHPTVSSILGDFIG